MVADYIRLGQTSGWVSVALWVVVFSPQIWECYILRSGEGLSVVFLFIWLSGDITGLIGAVMQNLALTMSLLAGYYAICDMILLALIFFYRWQRRNHPERFGKSKLHLRIDDAAKDAEEGEDAELPDENTPLLRRKAQSALSFAQRHRAVIIIYTLSFSFIIATGIISWILTAPPHAPVAEEEWNTAAQVVGWISAALYLGSRIPQIYKNTKTKCQGLSLMMFCFSILGNTTYCLSILFPSTAPSHVYINLSWLIGAGGTLFLDFVVLGQFIAYRKERNEGVFIEGGESQVSGI